MKQRLLEFIEKGFVLHPDVVVETTEHHACLTHLDGASQVQLSGLWSQVPSLIQAHGSLVAIEAALGAMFPTVSAEIIHEDLLSILAELYEAQMLTCAPVAPLVSFVVPAYNAASTIARTLRALCSQDTTHPYEVILVDNGSTDATLFEASSFPITILREPRRSRSYARNRGLYAARGTYVAFVDSDVYVASTWMDTVLAAFTSEHIAAVQSQIQYLATASNGILKQYHDHMNHGAVTPYPNMYRLPIPFCDTAAMMVRRQICFEHGIRFDTWLGRSEDVDLSFQLFKHGASIAFAPVIAQKDLGHDSLLRLIGVMFRQSFWDRRLMKRWLPALGLLSPTGWDMNRPLLPKQWTTMHMFGALLHLVRWLGWWVAALSELFIMPSLQTHEVQLESPTAIRSTSLQPSIRLAISPDAVRIVRWHAESLLQDTGLMLNKTARQMLVELLATGDETALIARLAEQYHVEPATIGHDFEMLKGELTAAGVL